jgi:hypothetical protein
METLKEFKSEYRLISSDLWGDAMEAWFECAAHLHLRNLTIPNEWEYKPAPCNDNRESDCYWYELFNETDNDLLIEIGNFLFRYCQLLKFYGKDY